ncbi:FecR family protein [Luteolibacter arcticus]|uniref:FecR family protein n=1 Tax=Luteolibacter arcticus TaxID=1581411 RepID=A0ABT3GN44_9BACT|nr:FecR family protein [Luteolibacter arcticus]MCW1924890.1 FecR family protein [Luteolibacter arcticus]
MKSHLDQLMNKWIEGDLDPEDAESLRELLAEDPAARETCYDMMLLDQLLGEREEARAAFPEETTLPFPTRKLPSVSTAVAAVASLAALIFAGLWITARPEVDATRASSPPITASSDSRITIAQREDRGQWSPGELLRLERGTAAIQLREGVLAHFEGPAAIELVNALGDIRLLEGRGSFQAEAGGQPFTIETPGGTVRGSGTQFVCQILPDQAALVEVNTGSLELAPHTGRGPSKVNAGEAVRLEGNGTLTPTARPFIPFRSGLPEELALFQDDFKAADGTLLSDHVPQTGQKWEATDETNPTVIIKEKLDTSSGSRRLFARLAPHDPGGTGSVYIFSFSLTPPSWSHDKVQRMDGIEAIAILDPAGHELFSLMAEAVNTHRWQLKGGGQLSPLTPVCALWDHQLTVCYGLDGRVTLHDGGTAQAPVIASIWLKDPAPVESMLISNRTGGDLAFRRIGTALLRAPSVHAE